MFQRAGSSGDRSGRAAVVEVPFPHAMGQGVDVGHVEAVEGETEVLHRPPGPTHCGIPRICRLTRHQHVPLGGPDNLVGAVRGHDIHGARHPDAFGHRGDGESDDVRSDEIQCSPLIVGTPATPVGEAVEIAQDFFLGGNRPECCPSPVAWAPWRSERWDRSSLSVVLRTFLGAMPVVTPNIRPSVKRGTSRRPGRRALRH